MKAIVAVDLNWGIGLKGQLLENIPEDMKFFRAKTLDTVVVMGRETLESFPGKQPLKNRVNIVLSRSMTNADNLVVCDSIEQLIESLKGYADKEVFVIGGQSVYTQLLPYCDTVYVTKINNTHEADRYFPNLDEMEEWVVAEESEVKSYNDTEFKFVTYVRK